MVVLVWERGGEVLFTGSQCNCKHFCFNFHCIYVIILFLLFITNVTCANWQFHLEWNVVIILPVFLWRLIFGISNVNHIGKGGTVGTIDYCEQDIFARL